MFNNDGVAVKSGFNPSKNLTVKQYYNKQRAHLVFRPKDVDGWLKLVWLKFSRGQRNAARAVLASAFQDNPDSEEIWLAAIQMEVESGELLRAERLVDNAIKAKPQSEKLWIKKLKISPLDLDLAEKACKEFPNSVELAIMKAKVRYARDEVDEFKEANAAFSDNPKFAVAYFRFLNEIGEIGDPQAFDFLEKALTVLWTSEDLWLEKIRHASQKLETVTSAKSSCTTKGPCPDRLKAVEIRYSPTDEKKELIANYLEEDYNYQVLYAAALYYWRLGSKQLALDLVEAAVKENPKFGDAWALWYAIVDERSGEDALKNVVRLCLEAQPDQGDLWEQVAEESHNWNKNTEQLLVATSAEVY